MTTTLLRRKSRLEVYGAPKMSLHDYAFWGTISSLAHITGPTLAISTRLGMTAAAKAEATAAHNLLK